MTINLSADLETAVANEAQRLGTTPQRFVEATLRARLSTPALDSESSIDQRLQRLLAIARPCGVSLSNEALSSEGLYD